MPEPTEPVEPTNLTASEPESGKRERDPLIPVTFTQYLRPNGRQKAVTIGRPPAIAAKARQLLDAGCHLDAEVLTTGHASFTVEDETVGDTGPLAHEIAANGPLVLEAVDRLIERAYQVKFGG